VLTGWPRYCPPCTGRTRRLLLFLAAAVLLLSSLGCGLGGLNSWLNNDVRRAALDYELQTRGPTGEVMVAFGLTEVRDNLGFLDGNTVWLNPIAEGEYFRDRDAGLDYVFLHHLSRDGDTASIVVDREEGGTVRSFQLQLEQQNGVWQVTGETPLSVE
jgi:hypothetical protein